MNIAAEFLAGLGAGIVGVAVLALTGLAIGGAYVVASRLVGS